MAHASVKLKDGTTIEVDGSTEEVLRILTLYPGPVESKSATGIETIVTTPTTFVPPKSQTALIWARAQMNKSVQVCKTPECKYNYAQAGIAPCSTPNPRADADDVKKENHENYHPFWNFYCMRFVRSAYGASSEYAKAHDMYEALSRTDRIHTDGDIPLGALIFWFWAEYGHIGIYSGDGKVIHTGVNPTTKKNGIRESPIKD